MSKTKSDSLFWGLLILAVGVLFLLDNVGLNVDIWSIIGTYWPVILILIGAKNIYQHYQPKS
jgi:lia operon protein LiaF